MHTYLIIGVTVAYLGAAVSYLCAKNYGMMIVFAAYALANVGLLIAGGK